MKLVTLVIDDDSPWDGYSVTAFAVPGGRTEGHEGFGHSLDTAIEEVVKPLLDGGVINS